LHANPTAGEKYHHEYTQNREEVKAVNQVSILDTYGGAEYLKMPPKELVMGQTESYVEYSRTGQVIKGKERAKARSKYVEDQYINNHTQVWGSFFDVSTRQWGYACCRSTVQASYCTGQAGIEAVKASSAAEMLKRAAQRLGAQKGQTNAAQANADSDLSKRRLGEGDLNLDRGRLVQALSMERKRKAVGEDEDDRWGGKRPKYGREGTNVDITEEELEAYRMSRRAGNEDPMFNYNDTED